MIAVSVPVIIPTKKYRRTTTDDSLYLVSITKLSRPKTRAYAAKRSIKFVLIHTSVRSERV
jgi:hypothetical protein